MKTKTRKELFAEIEELRTRLKVAEETLLSLQGGDKVTLKEIAHLKKANETLLHLASFPELNPNPVTEVDLAGNVHYLNPAVKQLFPDLQTAGLQHLWLAGLESLSEMLEHQKKRTYAREVKIGDIWYEQTVYYVLEGKRLRIYGLDITERKRAEEALRQSEQHEWQRAAELAAVLDAVPAAVWIAHDPDCLHITGNRTADELLRLPEGTESSLSAPAPVRPQHFKAVKDGREMTLDELPVQQAARGGPVRDFEFSLVFTDGTVRHMLGNASPLLDELGQPRGSVAAFVDITERKQVEEKLKYSERKYRELYEGSQDGFVLVDMEGHIKEFNHAYMEMLGYSEEELMRLTYMDLTPQKWHAMEAKIVEEQVFSKGYSTVYEKEYIKKDGTIFPISLRTYLIKGTNGNPKGMWAFVRDITKRKEMEEALRRSRNELEIRVQERTAELAEQSKILEGFFTSTITPLVFLDRDFNFIRVNEAYAKACQREISEFPGHNHFEFYPSDAKEIFEQVVETKTPYQATARPFSFPDHPEWGTTYWDWTLTPLLDEMGEVEFLVFSLEDVTERKRAGEAVKAERQRLNDVLEMLPAYLVLLAPDYHVPFANRLFRERFGESHGQRCFEYLFGRCEPCEICESYTVLKTMAPHEWEWTGPDGRNYDVFDFPFTDTDGSTLILEMGIDITERKRAEEQFKAASLYARSLIEASLDPLVTISRDGKIMDVNSSTELITGVPREQLTGSDFLDYFMEPEKAREGYQQVFETGSVRDYPLAIRHTSGMITDVLYNATIYRNEAGEIQGVFAAARDITERKRAEDALKESENRLRHLSSQLLTVQENERKRIARELHDGIGQILTAVKFKVESTIQEMEKGKGRPKKEPLEDIIPMIKESIEEVRRIQMDLRPSTLDDLGILATLEWFCREYQKIYSHIHIEKESDLQESEVSTPLKTAIYRVMQEAMNNIAKHSKADLVKLSLGKQENKIQLIIQDNGQGFDLEEILSPDRSRRGMGLNSMRERTELSGGSFVVESTRGQGTVIRALWPTG
jgi:PAS domain S-box-containing protein